jgi:predicted DNA-binding ribbon-helix-helix protein
MTIVALALEDAVYEDLKQVSDTSNLSSEQMITRIIKNYLHVEKMNAIRKQLKGTAEAAGFFSEEDIYREIS